MKNDAAQTKRNKNLTVVFAAVCSIDIVEFQDPDDLKQKGKGLPGSESVSSNRIKRHGKERWKTNGWKRRFLLNFRPFSRQFVPA